MKLGEGFVPKLPVVIEPIPEPAGPSDTELVLAALAELRAVLARPAPPPQVIVPEPDLSAIVSAVVGLKPGADADDIARAVVSRLAPMPTQDNLAPVLGDIAKVLDALDFRLKGPSAVFGGGIVHFDPAQLNPDGTLKVGAGPPVLVDPHNSTTVALAASGSFIGTATDISLYAQVNLELFARPSKVQGDGSSAEASLFFEFSPDAINWDISVPILVRDPGLFIPYPLINVGKYFRVRYLNDGGTAAISALGLTDTAGTPTTQTVLRLQTQLLADSTKELARTLDQGVSGSDPVALGRDVIMGKTTDGTYFNLRADGVVANNSSTATLTAGSTFTGPWFDGLGYASFGCLVNADQVSAGAGWQVQFSPDSGTTTVATLSFSYATDDLNNGIRQGGPMFARYIRVVYTNGGTNQTRFNLQLNLSTVPAQAPQTSFDATFTDAAAASTFRGVIAGRDPIAGTWANITRSQADSTGRVGHDVAVMEFDVPAPIKALTTYDVGQVLVSPTTATAILNTGTTGRKTFAVKNLASNTKAIFIGPTSGVTVANGWELAAGETVVVEIDATTGCFGLSASGTQGVCFLEVS